MADRLKALIPDRKWWRSTVIGLGGIATAVIASGHWTKDIAIATVTLVVQRLSSAIDPADSAP